MVLWHYAKLITSVYAFASSLLVSFLILAFFLILQGGEAAWSPHLLGLSYLPRLLLTPSILLIEYFQGFIFPSSGHSLGALIVMRQISNVLFKKKNYLFIVIALQYCDGFCPTSVWICIGVHVSPPSWTPLPSSCPPNPSRLSRSTGFRCPASHIKLALVIYFPYSTVYVSVLFSQSIPPSPSLLCMCLVRMD